MAFQVEGKYALITGGASGLGLLYAKELLRNGLKGVTLADMSEEFGEKALKEIEEEFGPDRAIFVKTDVVDYQQFDNAYQKTVEKFRNVDILINNAGILNDAVWEKQIAININGTIHGILLGLEKYFPKYKQGTEALIVNISSTAGLQGYGHVPVYCATKHAVIGMGRGWSDPFLYERTKVRFITVCPGVTLTPLIFDMGGRNMGGIYEEFLQKNGEKWVSQEPDHMAKEMVNIIKNASNGTIWVVEGGDPAYEYIPAERRGVLSKK
ncbi:15-hydroxyprostaglandin dehydrogenase [NAD(+)] isoform X2 [Leptinotarsa decemlineata]|uniref:15-hydroxyprostaglandin dehydrogenase [NAD(+)] isoform X2 n=1 Tax=Leptinotarsa decemlineata TaxID=7539 RepID=UPI003D3076C4